MAVDFTALKTEFETDPVTMGYLPLATAANDVANADIINNKNGDKPRTVNNDNVDTGAIRAEVTFDAFDGLTAAEENYIAWLTQNGSISVNADTLQNLAGVGGNSLWAVADRPIMDPRMDALMRNPNGSRAQEIQDTIGTSFVTPSDVANARNLG